MAACTQRISTPSTANASTYVSGSFTPALNELLVFIIAYSATTVDLVPTLTDSLGTITFTRVLVREADNHGTAVAVFVANQLAAASARTVTFGASTSTGAIISGVGVSGMSKTGATAILQSASVDKVTNGGSVTTPFVTLGASVNTSNPTVAGVFNAVNPATMTPPTSWTERDDTGYATPTVGLETCTRDSGFTGTTLTWGNTALARWQTAVVELDTSSSAHNIAVGTATETDTALAIAWAPKDRLAAVALETDTALAVGRNKAKALGIAPETDTALVVGRQKLKLLGLAPETDSALTIAWAPKDRLVGKALETDTALAIAASTSGGGVVAKLRTLMKVGV